MRKRNAQLRLVFIVAAVLAVCALPLLPASGQSSLKVKGLAKKDPLKITATASPTELIVEVDLEKGWHLYGKDVVEKFTGIGYGWDSNAIRVGVAGLVRAGAVKLIIGQKE